MKKNNHIFYLAVLAIISIIVASCGDTLAVREERIHERRPPAIEVRPAPDVRVMLLKNVKSAQLAIHSAYKFSHGDTVIAEGDFLPEQPLRYSNKEFYMGDRVLGSGRIQVVAQDGAIELNGTRYHGNILLLSDIDRGSGHDNKFSVVEQTDIERYMMGVIGSEMPSSWDVEALRAQAITARTYALHRRNQRGDSPYDINGLGLAYQGLKNENMKLNTIVEETRGIVMLYNNKVFPAYFHSTCGGRTEDANLVFNEKQGGIPPLSGVRCGFCNASKYYYWQTEIDKSVLAKKLRTINAGIKNIRAVQPIDFGPGNHSSVVRISYTGGTQEMNSNEFRLLIGSAKVRSTAFNTSNTSKTIKFSGKGWGHGVGLCQYGAQGMAKNGYEWYEILKYYYPEIEISKIY